MFDLTFKRVKDNFQNIKLILKYLIFLILSKLEFIILSLNIIFTLYLTNRLKTNFHKIIQT